MGLRCDRRTFADICSRFRRTGSSDRHQLLKCGLSTTMFSTSL